MVLQKKPKSRRLKLHVQKKLDAKGRERIRKARKLVKKSPHILKRKYRKDPGIPQLWPHKEDILLNIQRKKQLEASEKARKRHEIAERRRVEHEERIEAEKLQEAISRGDGNCQKHQERMDELSQNQRRREAHDQAERDERMAQLAEEARVAQSLFLSSELTPLPLSSSIGSESGAGKAFYRDLRKTIQNADVLIEVVDARDPNNCRCEELENSIVAGGKKLIILLNKIDLVPRRVVADWLAYMRRRYPTVAFKSILSTAGRVQHSSDCLERASPGLMKSACAVIGAQTLLGILKNYCRHGSAKDKGTIRVGVIGYPNVGKSSVINSLARSVRGVKIGGEAGVTRSTQEVQLDSNIWLIDSPGVVFSGSIDDPDNVLRNSVKLSAVKDPKAVVAALLKRCPPESLIKYFKTVVFSDVEDFLAQLARDRGRLGKGGKPDTNAAARMVLTEWTSGKIPYYCSPPFENTESKVASSMLEAIDLDQLEKGDSMAIDTAAAEEERVESLCLTDVGCGTIGSDPRGESAQQVLNFQLDDEGLEATEKEKQQKASAPVSNQDFISKRRRRRSALVEGDMIALAAKKLEAAQLTPQVPPINRRAIEKRKLKTKARQIADASMS